MTQESFPRNPAGDILDESGRSISEVSQSSAEEHRGLAAQKHIHELERDALKDASQGKLKKAADLQKFQDRGTGTYNREMQELREDAGLLDESARVSANRTHHYSWAIKESDEEAAAHVDENLPAYIQAATEMANAELEPRIGQKVPVTSIEKASMTSGYDFVGFTEVKPVDPARSNEDVASHIKAG